MRAKSGISKTGQASRRYDLEGVQKDANTPLFCKLGDQLEPSKATASFNFYPKQDESIMLLRKS